MESNLTKMLEAAKQADPLYQATSFWESAVSPMLNDLESLGIENFRNWPTALAFFVPTYGFPGHGLRKTFVDSILSCAETTEHNDKEQAFIRQSLNGWNQALSDFRVVKASLDKPDTSFWSQFSESCCGNPIESFVFDGRTYSRSSLNYLMGLAALSRFTDLSDVKRVVEIGGGFGSLGEILYQWHGNAIRYVNLDIPPTCAASDFYLKTASNENDFSGLSTTDGPLSIDQLTPLNVLPNWRVEDLRGSIDLFVNYISFQEMEPDVVSNYLQKIDRLEPKWILIRHIREGKQVRSASNPVGVERPTTPSIYADELKHYRQVYQDCDLYGYRTADDFHSDIIILQRT